MPEKAALSPVAALLRRHDHDRFLTALFAPAAQREALFALYAFNYEIAKTRETVREPLIGRMRLQWWRDSIAEIYAGQEPRRHEVVEPLARAIRAHDLSRALFDRLIDARETDLRDEAPADGAALEIYATESGAPLTLLALEVLGSRDDAAIAAGRAVGIGYALAGLLRAVPFHARMKRLYLPADMIAGEGVDVAREIFELKPSPGLARIARYIAAAARAHLAEARGLRADVPRAALPALLPAVQAERWLDRLARAGHDVFDPRLALPDGGAGWRLTVAALRRRY